ncbi:hypothetical protein [Streptomyces sp. NPDC005876]|uniref:hypothetical protein n=1 Tax=unclassified Streptomyces TaxID=2593676 RepID=UPI0033D1BF2C
MRTEKPESSGTTYGSEYQLYDGLLRPRQIQTEGPDGGRLIADTLYDGSGRVVKTNDTYYTTGAPGTSLFVPVNSDVDAQTVTEYDGAGRPTASIFKVGGTEENRTTYSYGGDRVHVDPPEGQTPTTTITDVRHNTVTTTYDELGRTTGTWQGDADTGTRLSVTKYDTVAKGELYGEYTYRNGAVHSSVLQPVLDEMYRPTLTRYTVSKTAEPELGGTYECGQTIAQRTTDGVTYLAGDPPGHGPARHRLRRRLHPAPPPGLLRRRPRVHNLTVSATHTYYVLAGATPVLVHNCNGAKLEPTYKPDWSPEQIAAADEKVAALNAAPQLIVTKVQRSGSAADVWRELEIGRCPELTSIIRSTCNSAGLMMSTICGHLIVR